MEALGLLVVLGGPWTQCFGGPWGMLGSLVYGLKIIKNVRKQLLRGLYDRYNLKNFTIHPHDPSSTLNNDNNFRNALADSYGEFPRNTNLSSTQAATHSIATSLFIHYGQKKTEPRRRRLGESLFRANSKIEEDECREDSYTYNEANHYNEANCF